VGTRAQIKPLSIDVRFQGLHVLMSLQFMKPERMLLIGTKMYLMHQGSDGEGVEAGTYMDAQSKGNGISGYK